MSPKYESISNSFDHPNSECLWDRIQRRAQSALKSTHSAEIPGLQSTIEPWPPFTHLLSSFQIKNLKLSPFCFPDDFFVLRHPALSGYKCHPGSKFHLPAVNPFSHGPCDGNKCKKHRKREYVMGARRLWRGKCWSRNQCQVRQGAGQIRVALRFVNIRMIGMKRLETWGGTY